MSTLSLQNLSLMIQSAAEDVCMHRTLQEIPAAVRLSGRVVQKIMTLTGNPSSQLFDSMA
jgi:hypothetical protein